MLTFRETLKRLGIGLGEITTQAVEELAINKKQWLIEFIENNKGMTSIQKEQKLDIVKRYCVDA